LCEARAVQVTIILTGVSVTVQYFLHTEQKKERKEKVCMLEFTTELIFGTHVFIVDLIINGKKIQTCTVNFRNLFVQKNSETYKYLYICNLRPFKK
jgi:uncharacterized membrane protein